MSNPERDETRTDTSSRRGFLSMSDLVSVPLHTIWGVSLAMARSACLRGVSRLVGWGRWSRLPALLSLLLAPLALPALAEAHAGPIASTPSPGIGLPQAPGSVVLRFSEPLSYRLSRIEVLDQARQDVAVGPTIPVEGDPRAMQRKLPLLGPGQYTVRWTTVSTVDGHTLRGSYTFGVAAAAARNEQVENDPVASEGWLGLLGRLVGLAGLLLWAGSTLTGPVAMRAGTPERRVMLLGRLGPLLALAGMSLSIVAAPVASTGSVEGFREVVSTSRSGRLRAGVIALSGLAILLGPRRRIIGPPLMGIALLSEAWSGHAASAARPVLAAASFAVHLAASGVWVFAILAAVLSSDRLIGTLAMFSPYAIVAAALVGFSGLSNTAFELSRPGDLWFTAYGRAVLGKTAAFVTMVLLGLTHYRRRQQPSASRSAAAWPLRLELGAAGVAIALATVLVAFPNPPAEGEPTGPLTRIDPVLAGLGKYDALSVAEASGPFIVGLTLVPPRPGAVELRLQVVGVAAGDAPRDARVRGASDTRGSFEATLFPCEQGFGCFVGRAQIEAHGTWRLAVSMTSNRGPLAVETTVMLPATDGYRELARAIDALERLQSAQLREELRVQVDGPLTVVNYRFRAPDAFGMTINERHRIVIGQRAFDRSRPSSPWTAGPWPGPAFTWPKNYCREFWREAVGVRLLGTEEVGGVRSNVVAFVRPDLPVWFRIWAGLADGLVRRHQMLAEGHIMDHRYSGFNEPVEIRAPI
jgi:copper transport protein